MARSVKSHRRRVSLQRKIPFHGGRATPGMNGCCVQREGIRINSRSALSREIRVGGGGGGKGFCGVNSAGASDGPKYIMATT